jgi:hypothetical protein
VYFERAGGGDEFRENSEISERFFRAGRVNEQEVRRAARGGDEDLAFLLFPSRERALLLDKASMALVREQKFELGRDGFPAPARNVHGEIVETSTGLEAARRVFADGALRLDWTNDERLAARSPR